MENLLKRNFHQAFQCRKNIYMQIFLFLVVIHRYWLAESFAHNSLPLNTNLPNTFNRVQVEFLCRGSSAF